MSYQIVVDSVYIDTLIMENDSKFVFSLPTILIIEAATIGELLFLAESLPQDSALILTYTITSSLKLLLNYLTHIHCFRQSPRNGRLCREKKGDILLLQSAQFLKLFLLCVTYLIN
jgi:hypothetical protein